MPLSATMTTVDFYRELDQAARDNAQEHEERVNKYIETRGAQIHEQRMSNLSTDDLKFALEEISDMPGTLAMLSVYILRGDGSREATEKAVMLRGALYGAINSAIRHDSMSLARTEAKALFNSERH